MKKRKITLLTISIISIFLIGYNIVKQKFILASTIYSVQKNIEIGNYNIDIIQSKLYENYLFTKYTVETLDKSELNQNLPKISPLISSKQINSINLQTIILDEYFISQYKKEITLISFYDNKNINDFEVKYCIEDIHSNTVDEISLNKKYYFDESNNINDGYTLLNNEINIGKIKINFKDFLIKDKQGILYFSSKEKYEIEDDYIIKIKSGDFEDIFFINSIKSSASYYVPITFNNKDINLNDLEISIINTNKNDKTLIYKNNQ